MPPRLSRATIRRLFAEANEPVPDEAPKIKRPTPAGVTALGGWLPVGLPGAWVVHVPGFFPLSLNRARNRHWSAEYRLKTATAKAIRGPLLEAGVTRAKGLRSVRVIAYRPDGKHPDLENVLKILNDPLKWLGVLVDDGPSWVRFAGYEPRTGEARTTLLIADALEIIPGGLAR